MWSLLHQPQTYLSWVPSGLCLCLGSLEHFFKRTYEFNYISQIHVFSVEEDVHGDRHTAGSYVTTWMFIEHWQKCICLETGCTVRFAWVRLHEIIVNTLRYGLIGFKNFINKVGDVQFPLQRSSIDMIVFCGAADGFMTPSTTDRYVIVFELQEVNWVHRSCFLVLRC